ncbi:MAG TPA: serine--tRNA ligase [Nitrososphaerales archaeon]|jgi:seryl-tRNA synthetase|nr:serine--tRNA ligase [Nitrososphaerales archaeon]|tara:strand:- start:8391 stop:9677 length:1287 start_codon:yes stop_codon:yes gene_type:complete
MLDMYLVRNNPQKIQQMLKKRHLKYPFSTLLELDKERRVLVTNIQDLKHKRNVISDEISRMKTENIDVSNKILETKEISQRIASGDKRIRDIDQHLYKLVSGLPNIPDETVPNGIGEKDNVVLRYNSKPPTFNFKPLDHIELTNNLGLVDLERASKVSGARFYFLKDDLVRLNYALINFALDFMDSRRWTIIQPPYMLKREAISGSIILSDFEDVIYKIDDEDLYLIGTSEHAIASMYMNEVVRGEDLPLRYAGISPCFRKEVGAHGRDTKGIFRVHQFEKVEQFSFSKPNESQNEHELMIKNAEDFFDALQIPYRIVSLCGGELGKVSSKTYDLEAWFPGQQKYRELVSCSNCTDYQARGLLVKYRDKPHEQSKFVHTLNSTLVATERTLIAIMENHQLKDGSIKVPKPLKPYVGNLEIIKANKTSP